MQIVINLPASDLNDADRHELTQALHSLFYDFKTSRDLSLHVREAAQRHSIEFRAEDDSKQDTMRRCASCDRYPVAGQLHCDVCLAEQR